jgi:pimeloyl-ACP methyl ester carboxylesterase
VWLSPSGSGERSIEFLAVALVGRAELVAKDLEVWAEPSAGSYSLADEVEGVRRVAERRGWSRFHAVGFSAGATVALLCEGTLTSSVATVAVIEPAAIGGDD